MDRLQKKQLVSSIADKLQKSYTVVLVHYHGLTVAEITKLRCNMMQNGAEFMVAKNSLAKLALVGTVFEQLAPLMTGPTAIAFSEDPISAAKVIVQFAKENDKLIIVGGAANDSILDVASVKALASMPSLDELRGKIIGILSTPATRVATVLAAPASGLARVISAWSKKGS
ncbi:50S ribosomal protein L10 [Candidatus Arcanobacter lacustris]|uniref:Large ribosomal subunit protein uL10 n=1 Tax=Candidatus Arcanibacter lacustris TaxID=1607817 RepID=A0A0F5MPF9_9RICK|nr:50S ribosomal protein L10 [Candidatus Arcanobacter lacustris]